MKKHFESRVNAKRAARSAFPRAIRMSRYDCLEACAQLALQLCCSDAQRTSWYSLTSPPGRRKPGKSCTLAVAGMTSVPWTRDSLPLL
eukprot:1160778-Amphidinium_carterae.1